MNEASSVRAAAKATELLTLDDVRAAAARIEGAVVRTPMLRSQTLSEISGADIWLKFENHQFTAAYKERGALNALLHLNEEQRARGVIAASAGNHSQGLSYHGRRLGVPVTIVMPQTTPSVKVMQTESVGGNVTLFGETFDEAYAHARKLESERTMLVDRNVGIQAELDQLKQQSRDRIAAVAATQQNNDRLVKEVTEQRKVLRDNQRARDKDFRVMLDATEAQDQAQGELNIVRAQNQAITRQVARMSKLLRANGVDPGLDPDFLMEPSDGIVSAVRRKGATQLIEVTIGADDGLQAGHTVEVFRGSKYLGRAEIISTSPDRAIGKLDRRFLRGQIQEGDRVATRLKLS